LNNKGLLDAVRQSSHLPYTYEKDYAPLQQQDLPLLVIDYPVSGARDSIPNLAFSVQIESQP